MRGKQSAEDGAATRGRIKGLLEAASALIRRTGAIVVVCKVVHTYIERRR
jgi:hypothetical protein